MVPTHADYPQIAPGVIFCLKQSGDSSGNEAVNPLQPYFLVYVRDDGVVRFTFVQPKQTLDMYRLLCAGQTAPYEELCKLFDQDTNNGADLGQYTELLRKSVDSIVHTFRRRTVASLLSGRGGVLPESHRRVSSTTDFELITWLVIKDDDGHTA